MLTSEAVSFLADFQATMKHLNWDLDEYYTLSRVRVNLQGSGDCPQFGLTPGQVVGKAGSAGHGPGQATAYSPLF